MARTPDVVANETIMSSWGNEIRDRTMQIFASAAEADAWNAPTGAVCYRTDRRRYFFRYGGGWRPLTPGDSFAGTADSAGDYRIAHGLSFTPDTAIVTPAGGNINFQIAQIMSIDATNIRVRCRNAGGTALASQAVSGYWISHTALP